MHENSYVVSNLHFHFNVTLFVQIKFTELNLDTFRMLQCLEWEPCGFFSLKGGADNGTGPNRINPLQDIRDPTLPANPRKVILYRPSITHLLAVSIFYATSML